MRLSTALNCFLFTNKTSLDEVMNFSIWWQAITTMPSLSPQQWQQLDIIARWLIATRASVFLMTISSASIGGLLAWRDGLFDGWLFLLTLIGLTFAHATNNLLNDLTDSAKGIDKNNYYRNQYGVHVLEDGLVSKSRFWGYILFTGGIALLAGALSVWERSGITLTLMSAGAFFVLFYTWPLKYIGLGEPAVLLVWGPLMIGGSYYVVSGQWSWPVAWLSMVYALGPTSVLFGKHIDKMDADRAKKVYSLPVILGDQRARKTVLAMLSLQYLLLVALVVIGMLHWIMLVIFINLPALTRTFKNFQMSKPDHKPDDFPDNIWPLWFSAYAFDHTRRFSGLFLIGLALDIAFFQ
jgi:1,4-dihydroxy-2-naphthoate octaprenyltransferase